MREFEPVHRMPLDVRVRAPRSPALLVPPPPSPPVGPPAGIHGKFSETFHGGMFQQKSLKTSFGRSKVHRMLDEL